MKTVIINLIVLIAVFSVIPQKVGVTKELERTKTKEIKAKEIDFSQYYEVANRKATQIIKQDRIEDNILKRRINSLEKQLKINIDTVFIDKIKEKTVTITPKKSGIFKSLVKIEYDTTVVIK